MKSKKGAFNRIAKRVSQEKKDFISNSLDISERINEILESQGKTPSDLARLMGKSPSEISKWLSGMHNLTIKTISKIQTVLGEVIIEIPKDKSSPINVEVVLVQEQIFVTETIYRKMKANPEENIKPSSSRRIETNRFKIAI